MPALTPVRRRFLEFIIAITAVHVVAITLYYALGVSHAAARSQRMFAWGWMAVTIAVVYVGLQRLKRARSRRR